MESKDAMFSVGDPHYGNLTPDLNDTIMRYGEDSKQFEHLRYHIDEDNHTVIMLLFIGSTALDLLANYGVPEAYADLPTSAVVDVYVNDQVARREDEFSDLDGLEGF